MDGDSNSTSQQNEVSAKYLPYEKIHIYFEGDTDTYNFLDGLKQDSVKGLGTEKKVFNKLVMYWKEVLCSNEKLIEWRKVIISKYHNKSVCNWSDLEHKNLII